MVARQPLPEPDLVSSARAANYVRLLNAVMELEVVEDVAAGKLAAPDVPLDWLRPLAAPHYGAEPSPLLARWLTLFGDDLETVRRAKNSVLYQEPVTDGNLAAAAQIAERILQLVKDAPPGKTD